MGQTSFSFIKNYKKSFGGSLLLGKRKSKRPLSTKYPIHLILKANNKNLFSPSNRSIQNLIRKTAKKFNIKIYDLSLNWSHIHLLIRLKNQNDYNAFIRAMTSLLCAYLRKKKTFLKTVFTLRPFTRILTWGKQFLRIRDYQALNQLEAFGLLNRKKLNSKTRTSPGETSFS